MKIELSKDENMKATKIQYLGELNTLLKIASSKQDLLFGSVPVFTLIAALDDFFSAEMKPEPIMVDTTSEEN